MGKWQLVAVYGYVHLGVGHTYNNHKLIPLFLSPCTKIMRKYYILVRRGIEEKGLRLQQ